MTNPSAMQGQATQKVVYDLLVKAALAGDVCPSNATLCEALGATSVSTPAHAIARMAKAGRLRVKHCSNGREIYLVDLDVTIISKKRVFTRKRNDRPAAVAADKPMPSESLVSRDPCFRCGVRGDIGCEHTPEWARPTTAGML
jgi:hypothetical protein